MNKHFPVDRGWAWIVLIGCILEGFILLGTLRCFGLYFVEFSRYLSASASSISLVLSMQTVVFSVTSLFILTVGDTFDASREFVIFGGLLVSLGYFLSSFAESPSFLLLSNGVLFGSGSALVNGPCVVMLGKYFERRRGMANALMNVGGSLGALVLPPLLRYLMDTYGLQGTLWIHTGLLLNVILSGAVLRSSRSWLPAKKDPLLNSDENNCEKKENELHRHTENNGSTYNSVKTNIVLNQYAKSNIVERIISVNEEKHANPATRKRSMSESHLTENSIANNSAGMRYGDNVNDICKSIQWSEFGSVTNIHLDSNYCKSKEDVRIQNDPNATCFEKLKSITCNQVFHSIFNIQLFKNKLFLLNVFVSFFVVQGCALIGAFLPPHAQDVGLTDNEAATLLSITASSDLVNKLVVAFISDNPKIKRHLLVSFSLLITGALTLLIPFYTNFWSLAVYSGLYGLFYGTFFALFPVLLVDFIGIQNLSKGLAFTMVMHGLSISAFNPIYGTIRDRLGSYIPAFYMMGGGIILGGLALCFEPVIRKLEHRNSGSSKTSRNVEQ